MQLADPFSNIHGAERLPNRGASEMAVELGHRPRVTSVQQSSGALSSVGIPLRSHVS